MASTARAELPNSSDAGATPDQMHAAGETELMIFSPSSQSAMTEEMARQPCKNAPFKFQAA